MKNKTAIRIAAAALALTLLLALCACGTIGPKSPPDLTVKSDGNTKAVKWSWTWYVPGHSEVADGNGRWLYKDDHLKPLKLTADGKAEFKFTNDPVEYEVRIWTEDNYDDSREPGVVLEQDGYTVTFPTDRIYIVEVHADWSTEGNKVGDAYYSFYTVPKAN